ncbi:MAG TPA: DUF4178 domain-containing protein [Pyrinomonadaceae bacterium]|jgi:ssDNA-binding Zn-finger/Zn-ribbon topoisomerase 1
MTALEASCPACGAPVAFKSGSSVVVVCDYCHSVVARTDRALEDLGRVAEVIESGSPLAVGMRGVYREVAFELTGRAQLAHAAGGFWDEWYAAFADGRWGWLAEAQGRFYLTYRLSSNVQVPPFEALEAGRTVQGIPVGVPLVVGERGEARMVAAEGEIPYRLTPGKTYLYADLSGQGGTFATIDYGDEPPTVYVGREVKLAELGIVDAGRRPERAARRVEASQLQCPQCAGPLELRAPDRTERVTCPNCGSLLDVTRGQLRFLKALETKAYAPFIPLGSTGEFEGQKMTLVGFMVRSVEFEGTRYFWEEYLLYNPSVGFRWLVQSDRHWSYVEAVPPGEIQTNDTDSTKVSYKGKKFKVFQDAVARVEYVQGEFYWKIEAGELVRAVDYVRPPQMLSKEVSGGVLAQKRGGMEAEEVNWSLGTYLPLKEVGRIFNVDNLPQPSTVAPNQPFLHKKVYKYWLLLSLVLFIAGFVSLCATGGGKVFEQTYTVQFNSPSSFGGFGAQTTTPAPSASTTAAATPTPAAEPATPEEGAQIYFTEPFKLAARQNIRVTGKANVDNNWLYVEGDLINEETGLVQQFQLPIEYYSGVEGGESWSEGDRERSTYLSALPAGTYTMRLEAQWEKWNKQEPPQFTVRVEQGVANGFNFLLALIALALPPILVAIKQFSFERRRWADSAFNPYDSSGGSDDE